MSGHLVRNLQVGSYLPIGLPQGDFLVPEATPVRPLFITAGSGITPVMSMLRTWDIVGNMPDIVHLHYAPHRYDVIFGLELRRLASTWRRYRFRPVHTREGGDAPSSARHFSVAQLEALCPDWRTREVWACGPQSMLASVEEHFEAAGRGRFLHIERFRAPMADVPDDAAGGSVTFRSNGRSAAVEADATTPLLRVAEDAGLNPAHGCRMGICHTCDVPLTSGRVRDLRTGEVVEEPGRTVQICISGAAGDCEIDLTASIAKQKELQR